MLSAHPRVRDRELATVRHMLIRIVVRNADHSITLCMFAAWMHAKDELYHGQRGLAKHTEILTTGYDQATG